MKDIAPYALLSAGIVYATYLVTASIENMYLSIAVKVLMVFVLYCAALWLLGSTIFREAVMFITKKTIARPQSAE